MIPFRRSLLTGLSAVALATTLCFTTTACRPKAKALPEPFTAKLVEIEGVQAVYTLRHPKLINAEIENLMTAVPETQMARMFFGELAAYGYPEFSDFAPDTNIGIAMLEMSAEQLKAGQPNLVAVAKIKENGKIWKLLTQMGVTLEKKGEWVWVGKDAAAIAAVKNPDALIAYVSQPQTEEIRIWGRVSPALLASAKEALFPALEAKLADIPAPDKKAALAYADVLWGYLAQLHSGGGSLDLNEHGIALSYYGQFLPDSATGTFLRYAHGPSPKIAESIPADGLISAVIRQNIPGQIAFVTGVMDALIAVNHPAGSEALKTAKSTYLALSEHNDGGSVISMNVGLPKGDEPPVVDMFGINTGEFTEAEINSAYKNTVTLSEKFTHLFMQTLSSIAPTGTPVPAVTQKLNENTVTIEGIKFGSIVTTSVIGEGDDKITTSNTQYYGVAGGNLVYASSEAALRAKLPAVIAKRAVANPIKIVLQGDQVAVGALHGENVVDMIVGAASIDATDADIQAQIKSIKAGYAAGEPVKFIFTASQAKAAATISIPYKFVSESLRLGMFAKAHAGGAAK